MTEDFGSTLQDANDFFYNALSNCSIKAMERVWLHNEDTVCIHPGWPPLRGWEAIRSSWVRIFQNTQMHQIGIEILAAKAYKKVGWISCYEQIGVMKGNQVETSLAFSTNIFTFTSEGWKIVVHHGLPVGFQEA